MSKNSKVSQTIGINALFLLPNQVGGAEYHLRSFIKWLEKVDKKNAYVVFCNQENAHTFSFQSKRWKKVICPVKAQSRVKRILFEQLFFSGWVSKYGCTILHSFGYWGVLNASVKQVVTVHDVNWRDCPEDFSWSARVVQQVLSELTLQKVAAVMTDSVFSQHRLNHYFPHFASKVHVIPPGLEPDFFARSAVSSSQKKLPFLLCVSAMYPHKKILYLLKLWRTLAIKQPNLKLLLIGQNGQDYPQVQTELRTLLRVKHLPKVSFSQLVRYYRLAQLSIFPSVYEGFGYPAYEALASGTRCLVGRKELFIPGLQHHFEELTGQPRKDIPLIQKLLKQRTPKTLLSKKEKAELNYQTSAKKLLALYNSL